MRRSIFWRFIAAYLIFAILGFCTINYATTGDVYTHLVKTQAESLYKGATAISASLANITSAKDKSFYESAILNFNNSTDSLIWITDANGIVLHSSNDNNDLVAIDNFDITYFAGTNYKIGHFYNCFSTQVLTVYSPIMINGKLVGYVFIHMSTLNILSDVIGIVDIFYVTYFIILLFSMILILAFIIYIYRPIRELQRATKEYANGNFSYDKIQVTANDELGDISSSLIYMAHQLKDADEYQKKFIANISHDFRSPLTSIKGYVEAIIDGTIPHEMQNKYLGIVLSESERLERLTNGLIGLNNWGTHKPGLIMENFNIDAIITSIIETFEGICESKSVTLKYSGGTEILVNADKDKIQQVLYNLIDNAIKFSNNNSDIIIRLYNKGDKIYCSVKDSGTGIPSKDINKIWDRFYKTDSSRGKDKTGSGIGLSIVKEIINAHHQTIDVISTEGVGTEFIFSLSKSKKK